MRKLTRCSGLLIILCVTLVTLAVPSIGFAQNLTNPSAVDFDASPNHATVTSSTPPVALVSSYLIEVYASSGALVKATDVGKPAPDALLGAHEQDVTGLGIHVHVTRLQAFGLERDHVGGSIADA